MGRVFGGLLAVLNSIGSLWVLGLMLLITADVGGRYFFNQPIIGVPEIVKLSIVAMFWVMMAYTLRVGGHLRTGIILDRLPDGGKRVVLVLNSLLGVLMFAGIAWLAFGKTMEAWEFGDFEGEHPMRIPVWPIWTALTLGAFLTAIQYGLIGARVAVRGPSHEDLLKGDE